MSTKLAIFNGTRGILLQGHQSTENPNPSDECSKLLLEHYDRAVGRALEAGNWDFAIRKMILPRLVDVPLFGYTYYYQKPAWRRLVFLSETGFPRDSMGPGSYEIDETGIATNVGALYCSYVTPDAVNTPGSWSESFSRYVEFELAEACIKVNRGVLKTIIEGKSRIRKEALGIDATQSPPVQRRSGSWSTANRRHRGAARGDLEHGGG